MNEPNEEQIKRFWEYWGFTETHNGHGVPVVVANTGEWLSKYPPIDLNNLFLYAVPKLDYAEVGVDAVHRDMEDYANAEAVLDGQPYYGKHKDPALALFWAIYKVTGD